jgi:ATP-dependent DNA helicase UvrD/PcrA
MKGKFCLGFFGDPMQQIYMTGVGEILLDEGWKKITKPENFRCPTTVLSVINNIRSQGDGLAQTRGRQLENGQAVTGTAKLFVLPADECRLQNLDRVRRWLAESCSDPHWTYDSREADVRILVIAHRMAAVRLGFPDLFAAFNDGAPESFSAGFREGTLWVLKPFLDVMLPLTSALDRNRQIEVMKLLRAHCPRLDTERLRGVNNSSELLSSLKLNILELAALMSPIGIASVLEVPSVPISIETLSPNSLM